MGEGGLKQTFDPILQKALIEHLGNIVYNCMPQFPTFFRQIISYVR